MDFTIRTTSKKDIKGLTKLLQDYDIDLTGEIETTENDVIDIINAIDDLDEHSWVVEYDNEIIGFSAITIKGNDFPSLVIVHPKFRNKGIENELIKNMVSTNLRGTLIVSSNNEYEHNLFSENNFIAVRHWFTMSVNLKDYKNAVVIPERYTIEPFKLNQDEASTYHAFEESFQTHFGYEKSSFEQFLERTEREGFDPNLWYLLRKDKEVVGFIFCKCGADHHGEITHLGIRPAFRKKGLGSILLYYAFSKFIEEGRPKVHLHVDSENGTNAVKVYEHVGMKVTRHFIRFDKELG